MQHLIALISAARKKPDASDQRILNLMREYLQILILKAVYESKYGKGLSFIGGTCLRICYDLKRYSEDLDFVRDRPIPKYSFSELNGIIVRFLHANGFEAESSVSEDKVVQKSFVSFTGLMHRFGISPMKSQRLHIKLEIDTRPTPVATEKIETFFVTKFDQIFPILKHTDDTLFAGKIAAALNRAYTKGRDFYDLIWYLNRKTGIDFAYLRDTFAATGSHLRLENTADVFSALKEKISTTETDKVIKDLGRFLEDPSEEQWLRSYPAVFAQASERYLRHSGS